MALFHCGIDYSLTSPAVCIAPEPFSFETCRFFYFGLEKHILKTKQFSGSLYPDNFLSQESRYDFLGEWALAILRQFEISEVAIEGYAFAAKGRVFNIGENTGLLKHKLWTNGYKINTVEPLKIKKFATGNGNASKRLMEQKFVEETGCDIRSLLNQSEKSENPSSDIIDGYYIAKYVSTLEDQSKHPNMSSVLQR